MTKLYELANDFNRIRDQIECADTETDLAGLCTEMDNLQVALEDKLDSCGKIFAELNAETAGISEEITRLELKLHRANKKADWLKGYIAFCLGEGRAIKTKLFSFTWRKSKAVNVISEELVPESYQRTKTTVEPDKILIKKDLEMGADIPGCELVERQSLQIK